MLKKLSVQITQVEAALALFAEGATVPFIARYRKERTGELDEVQLRQIAERYDYLTELAARKQTILEVIAQQEALTPALQAKIERCQSKTELEDLYLPYRPKRRTRATIAREQGLAPLADEISRLNKSGEAVPELAAIAQPYTSDEVPTADCGSAGRCRYPVRGNGRTGPAASLRPSVLCPQRNIHLQDQIGPRRRDH